MGRALSILLPALVAGYALWLTARMLRRRIRGQCALCGCVGCPLADGCEQLKRMKCKEDTKHASEDS